MADIAEKICHPEGGAFVPGLCEVCARQTDKRCSRCKCQLYCSRDCQKVDWKRHRNHCLEPSSLADQQTEDDSFPVELKVEVKSSRIHGLGVFALKQICKGERICYFDGAVQDATVKAVIATLPSGELAIKNAHEVYRTILDAAPQVDQCVAHPDHRRFRGRIKLGYMDASLLSNEFGVGQFINDASQPDLDPESMDFCRCSEELRRYQKLSSDLANCEIQGGHFWLVAVRDIQPSEELFIHYGFQFWLQKKLLQSQNPDHRFMYYALQDQDLHPFNLARFPDYDDETCEIFLSELIQMPKTYDDVKNFLFSLTMKLNGLDASALQ